MALIAFFKIACVAIYSSRNYVYYVLKYKKHNLLLSTKNKLDDFTW